MVRLAAVLAWSLLLCADCNIVAPVELDRAEAAHLRAAELQGAIATSHDGTSTDEVVTTDTESTTTAEVDTSTFVLAGTLACAGGTLYAVAALVVSWATRAGKEGRISSRCESLLGFAGWNVLNCGGLSVTLAYGMGVSVPMLNSFVYATNLVLNMAFQIGFKISPYTKNMRCGTILFALAAIQLSQLAPPPWEVNINQILQPSSLIWNTFFFFLWGFTTLQIQRKKHLPPNDTGKVLNWALHVACWGSFTDNWAKLQGKAEGTVQTVSWALYIPTGLFVMVLSVWAMSATNVAIYVPTNLCFQLVMNTLASLFIWGEAEHVDLLIAYLTSYVLCLMSVYIATEEADLEASFSNGREISARGLSKKEAVTPFGQSLVALADRWEEEGKQAKEEGRSPNSATRESIRRVLNTGAGAKVFKQEELVDLTLRLWYRINPSYSALGTVVAWMKRTPYFEEYLQSDPSFQASLEAPLSPEEKRAMLEEEAAPSKSEVELS